MSYDIELGDFSGNYTSNGNHIYYDHMEGGLPALDGLTGKQAGDKISGWIRSFDYDVCENWYSSDVGEPTITSKYDVPNGWGSTIGAIVFLMKLLDACRMYPRCKVYVSY